ncbi:glycosyltransferase family 4 protein [Paenibacillus xerothermodurans]|uniref:Glycosyltransferase family 1 protein n=1 Tax=Paenibacillus xerothermodurans TaxID=1977292 RepID=A0A2W1NY69_PAEXE|nr:glycosyltransferase family 4 protein [Paenibacillus xerothermodurans]PZE20472.1 glycosyltransferase family 1 protein [Paenibacillus xerothermodurans]
MSVRAHIIHAVTTSVSVKLMRGQLAYLRSKGVDLTVLSSPGEELVAVATQEGVSYKEIAMQREISPIRDLISLCRLIVFFAQKKPLLTNVGTPKAGFLCGIAAWMTRVPNRIYTLRGLRLETSTGLKRAILLLTEKIACAVAHKVICVSPSLQARAVSEGLVPLQKTIVLAGGSSNGVDTSRFATANIEKHTDLLQRHNIPPDAQVIGFVGRLTKDKGIVELVEAYQALKNEFPHVYLLLVGNYENGDPIPDEVKTVIKRDTGIILSGFVRDVVPYYTIMDVFVIPSYREGFCNVAIEAAAAGKPVITTNATGAVDTVLDGVTGYIVPVKSSEETRKAIRTLLCNPELGKEMGQAGRRRALNEFASPVIWDALYQLYGELINRR